MGRAAVEPAIRYYAKVDQRGPDECWPWTAACFDKGYGVFRLGNKQLKAHRFGYTLQIGPIPNGLCVCHTCDNPPCQNPAHWFLGTHGDNAADRERKGRANRARGEQVVGSFLTKEDIKEILNLYRQGVPQRVIATQYSTGQAYISRVVLGKVWVHLDTTRATPKRQSALTDDDVRCIRNSYQNGVSQQRLADEFQVNQTAISAIVRRKTWKHVS